MDLEGSRDVAVAKKEITEKSFSKAINSHRITIPTTFYHPNGSGTRFLIESSIPNHLYLVRCFLKLYIFDRQRREG